MAHERFRPGQRVEVMVGGAWKPGVVKAGFEYGYLIQLDDDQRATWQDAVRVRERQDG